MRHPYHVIIIGGGCSGTALAIHLIRLANRPLRVTLTRRPRTSLRACTALRTALLA